MKYHQELAITAKLRSYAAVGALTLLLAVVLNRLGLESIPLPLSAQTYREAFLFRRWPVAIALGLLAGAFIVALEARMYRKREKWFRQMEDASLGKRTALELRALLFPEFLGRLGCLIVLLLHCVVLEEAAITAMAAAVVPFGFGTGPLKRMIAVLTNLAENSELPPA